MGERADKNACLEYVFWVSGGMLIERETSTVTMEGLGAHSRINMILRMLT